MVDLPAAVSVAAFARAPSVPWPLALLPIVLAGVVTARAVPAGAVRRGLRAAAWVTFWLAVPVVLGGSLGGSGGRDATWLIGVGGVEALCAVAVYRALRNMEWSRRDRFGLVLGRRPGLLGDRLRVRADDRFAHMAVLGPTGSGKTASVLAPAVRQDLASGAGVTVIDPKGDLARAVVAEAERLGRPVAHLRPGDPDGARLNPLDAPPADAAETAVYALDRAFPGDHPFYRPLGQTLVRFAVRALVEVRPGAGLADLVRFLEDETMRLEVLVRVRDDDVRRYFRDVVAAWPARTRSEYTLGVLNALLALTGQPDVSAMFAPPATVDLAAHLGDGGVLVAELPVGRLGAAASLAGAFVLAALQRCALARPEGGRPHFVYCDEFATFAPGGFGEFLAMARSSRVGAIVAHQHMGQLPRALREAVEANARTRVVLGGVAADDAEALARAAAVDRDGVPAFVREVRYLPRGEAVVLGVDRGQAKPPRRLILPRVAAPPRG